MTRKRSATLVFLRLDSAEEYITRSVCPHFVLIEGVWSRRTLIPESCLQTQLDGIAQRRRVLAVAEQINNMAIIISWGRGSIIQM